MSSSVATYLVLVTAGLSVTYLGFLLYSAYGLGALRVAAPFIGTVAIVFGEWVDCCWWVRRAIYTAVIVMPALAGKRDTYLVLGLVRGGPERETLQRCMYISYIWALQRYRILLLLYWKFQVSVAICPREGWGYSSQTEGSGVCMRADRRYDTRADRLQTVGYVWCTAVLRFGPSVLFVIAVNIRSWYDTYCFISVNRFAFNPSYCLLTEAFFLRFWPFLFFCSLVLQMYFFSLYVQQFIYTYIPKVYT